MMAAITRSTPVASLTPSQSQNAATVHEFRCMFTHDIFKKKKKWHDGSLRFHTFNSRVMVYDDAKNFVGDLHYRQTDEFDEGLEFQLDKPVKVVVEERLSESKTDLTPLLQRSRADGQTQANNISQIPRTQASHVGITNLQGRPKSIRELLGPSQRQLGRGSLPQRSPFEQRQALLGSGVLEPPAKKQRIAEGKENVPRAQEAAAAGSQPRNRTVLSHGVSQSRPSNEMVVELSSDDDTNNLRPVVTLVSNKDAAPVSSRCRKDPASIISVPTRSYRPTEQEDVLRSSKSLQVPKNSTHNYEDAVSERSRKESTRTTTTKATTHNKISETAYHKAKNKPIGPRSSLSFANHAPRPKLMYRGLLNRLAQANKCLVIGRDNKSNRGKKKSTMADIDDFFEQVEQETVVPRSDAPGGSVTVGPGSTTPTDAESFPPNKSQLISEDMEETIDSNAMFVSQSASQMTVHATQHSAFTDFEIPPQTQVATKTLDPCLVNENANAEDINTITEDDFQQAVWKCAAAQDKTTPSPNTCHTEKSQNMGRPDANSCTTTMDISISEPDIQLSSPVSVKPRIAALATELQPRTFRRVQSEADAELDFFSPEDEFDLSPVHQQEGLQDRNPTGLGCGQKLSLQRSVSDSAAIDANELYDQRNCSGPRLSSVMGNAAKTIETHTSVFELANPLVRAPEVEVNKPSHDESTSPVDETGPWTVNEAFLLFDHWPSEKQQKKPDYGQAEPTCTISGMISCVQENRNSVQLQAHHRKYGNFGSARFVSQR